MEQIAVISDIHGNITALKEVLKDIKRRKIKTTICLGDIIGKGINADKCINLVKENCKIVIKGNCDDYYAGNNFPSNISVERKKQINAYAKSIAKENNKYLKQLPFAYEMYISGSLVRFFHASPKSYNSKILWLDSIEEKYSLFKPSTKTPSQEISDITIYGHLHQPFIEKLYNKTLVNCGSVGNTINIIRDKELDSKIEETTPASYLIIEGEVNSKDTNNQLNLTLIRLPYNIEEELELNKNNPELSSYKKELLEGKYRRHSVIESQLREKNIINKEKK